MEKVGGVIKERRGDGGKREGGLNISYGTRGTRAPWGIDVTPLTFD